MIIETKEILLILFILQSILAIRMTMLLNLKEMYLIAIKKSVEEDKIKTKTARQALNEIGTLLEMAENNDRKSTVYRDPTTGVEYNVFLKKIKRIKNKR